MWLPPFLLLVLTTLFSAPLLALELPALAATQASSELDSILRSAEIELPLLNDDALIQDSAKSLITATQKARIAIVQHVIDSEPQKAGSAVTRAKRLQDELMHRVQSHLVTQLDQRQSVANIEWQLHRGFKDGVVETKGASFTERILRPEKVASVDERLDQDGGFKKRLALLWGRIKALLRDMDPIAAARRWRIRRLLNKLSVRPALSATPPLTLNQPAALNPTPWDLDRLRARLSAITALKSIQSQTAAAEVKDAAAAALIDNAPAIQSDLVLAKPLIKPETMRKQIKSRPLPGADGTRAERKWTQTLLRVGPSPDWNNVLIPGMAR